MSKDWDKDKGGRDQWVSWLTEIMTEARRVLKPGGHAVVWSMPRTSHWTGYALENAGFEIRDTIEHLYGEGMPKSHNISKAIDRMRGAERPVIGVRKVKDITRNVASDLESGWSNRQPKLAPGAPSIYTEYADTAPATPEAAQWSGFGTGLKPAHETWWLVRKPLAEASIAANVLEYGTGALNIDACRIDTKDQLGRVNQPGANGWKNSSGGATRATYDPVAATGRWPANLVLSHTILCNEDGCAEGCPVAELDRQSGISPSNWRKDKKGGRQVSYVGGKANKTVIDDQGGASRYFANFFYASKASRKERNLGCDELPAKFTATMNDGIGGREHNPDQPNAWNGNHHPTVKPISLMRYLTRLVTPPGGLVLDPFAGSGSTGVACVNEGFRWLLIDENPEYVQIARARVAYALAPLEIA
jgi:site-specific DNA-methyltransferase (adenine-specific)